MTSEVMAVMAGLHRDSRSRRELSPTSAGKLILSRCLTHRQRVLRGLRTGAAREKIVVRRSQKKGRRGPNGSNARRTSPANRTLR